MAKLIILGGPKTGKTFLADKLAAERGIRTIKHTDDLIPLGWSEASQAASLWFDLDGDWIIEGVAGARALRKWLEANPNKPLDAELILLTKPYVKLLPGQLTMQKGIHTVLTEIAPALGKRGVTFSKG